MCSGVYTAVMLRIARSDIPSWDRLDALQHRCLISAPEADAPINRSLFMALCSQVGDRAPLAASVDQQDVRNIIKAFCRGLHQMPMECSAVSMTWFLQAVWSGPTSLISASNLIVIVGNLLESTIKTHGYKLGYRWHSMQLGAILLRHAAWVKITSLQNSRLIWLLGCLLVRQDRKVTCCPCLLRRHC